MVKINVYDKIMIEKRRKGNMEIKKILHESPLWFTNGIHNLLRRANTRGSADTICRMLRISLLCRSCI